MADFTALAAAPHTFPVRVGCNVEADGLCGGPLITMLIGDELHVSVLKALSPLGLWPDRVARVPVDGQGRKRPEALPALDSSTIICLQAGNVNTAACDLADEICAIAHEAGAWVHIDGAFGLWVAAASSRGFLTAGVTYAVDDRWREVAHVQHPITQEHGQLRIPVLVVRSQPWEQLALHKGA